MYAKTDKKITDNNTHIVRMNFTAIIGFVIIDVRLSR